MIQWPNWMRGSLAPDEIIGEHRMLRWYLIPPTRLFAIYLHKHTGDDPREPHDHPADNVSIRLAGDLTEHRPSPTAHPWQLARGAVAVGGDRVVWFIGGQAITHAVKLPRIRWRRAEEAHRLTVENGTAITIWIRFRARREWGYYEPNGWRAALTRHQPDLRTPAAD